MPPSFSMRRQQLAGGVLVSYYPSGATIGWHRDAPVFGDVVGVSLEEFIAAGTVQPITWP
jgi:alkylated DNA repair dioxygenase AlkB